MRSKWKGLYVAKSILKQSNFKKDVVWNRNTIVTDSIVGTRVSVYNGRSGVSLLIRSSMLFSKLGAYVLTKKLGSQIHQRSKRRTK